jgi:hypothetical protein
MSIDLYLRVLGDIKAKMEGPASREGVEPLGGVSHIRSCFVCCVITGSRGVTIGPGRFASSLLGNW